MEKARVELESLKEQRSQQVKMTESIVRQRDMYRVLLAQATGVSFPQQGNGRDKLSYILLTQDRPSCTCTFTYFQYGTKQFKVIQFQLSQPFLLYFVVMIFPISLNFKVFLLLRYTTRGVLPDLHPPTLTCSHSHLRNTNCTRLHGNRVC